MVCPECGASLSTYTYGGRAASVCERCGYVGIEVDHSGTPVRVESWDDALRRFQEDAHGNAVRVESRADAPSVPAADTDRTAEDLPPLPETRVVTDPPARDDEVETTVEAGDGAGADDADEETEASSPPSAAGEAQSSADGS